MLNAIDYALRQIKLAIPKEVLEKTFLNQNDVYKRHRGSVNIDHLIKREVIYNYIMVDANLIGASKMSIGMEPGWIERIDTGTLIARIPKSFTQNRTITEVLNVSLRPANGYMLPYGTNQAISDQSIQMQRVLSSYKLPVISGTTNATVVGENTVLFTGLVARPADLYISVMVDYDDQLSSLNKSSYLFFGELCILAVKAYIWANKIISMDKAEIEGGYALNRYTAIVEDYSTAYEDYKTYFLEKWRKISFQADAKRMEDFIGMITKAGL